MTLTGTTTPTQSEPESNANEAVLQILHSLIQCPGHLLIAEMQSA